MPVETLTPIAVVAQRLGSLSTEKLKWFVQMSKAFYYAAQDNCETSTTHVKPMPTILPTKPTENIKTNKTTETESPYADTTITATLEPTEQPGSCTTIVDVESSWDSGMTGQFIVNINKDITTWTAVSVFTNTVNEFTPSVPTSVSCHGK